MPLFTPDRLLLLRDGTANLTATEAAGTNAVLLPPGEYWVNISIPAAATGTTPTASFTFSEAADGSTWAAINPQVTYTADATKAQEEIFRVRVTKQPNAGVTTNFTVVATVGGTTPNFGKVWIGVAPQGGSGYAGKP